MTPSKKRNKRDLRSSSSSVVDNHIVSADTEQPTQEPRETNFDDHTIISTRETSSNDGSRANSTNLTNFNVTNENKFFNAHTEEREDHENSESSSQYSPQEAKRKGVPRGSYKKRVVDLTWSPEADRALIAAIALHQDNWIKVKREMNHTKRVPDIRKRARELNLIGIVKKRDRKLPTPSLAPQPVSQPYRADPPSAPGMLPDNQIITPTIREETSNVDVTTKVIPKNKKRKKGNDHSEENATLRPIRPRGFVPLNPLALPITSPVGTQNCIAFGSITPSNPIIFSKSHEIFTAGKLEGNLGIIKGINAKETRLSDMKNPYKMLFEQSAQFTEGRYRTVYCYLAALFSEKGSAVETIERRLDEKARVIVRTLFHNLMIKTQQIGCLEHRRYVSRKLEMAVLRNNGKQLGHNGPKISSRNSVSSTVEYDLSSLGNPLEIPSTLLDPFAAAMTGMSAAEEEKIERARVAAAMAVGLVGTNEEGLEAHLNSFYGLT